MSLTAREAWALIHGMILGGAFLLAFTGGLLGLYSFAPELLTAQGIRDRLRQLVPGTWLMAIVAWLTVFTGTYTVYPWYRAVPPQGATDLTLFPKSFLVANAALKAWHSFGMEWKEHVAWFAPILATAVAYLIWKYAPTLVEDNRLRKICITVFVTAFAAAAIAGLLGALITKAAPIR
jgi:hypothetical protein